MAVLIPLYERIKNWLRHDDDAIIQLGVLPVALIIFIDTKHGLLQPGLVQRVVSSPKSAVKFVLSFVCPLY